MIFFLDMSIHRLQVLNGHPQLLEGADVPLLCLDIKSTG